MDGTATRAEVARRNPGALIIATVFNFAAVQPGEHDSVGIKHFEFAGYESRVPEFAFGYLAFPMSRDEIGSPGDFIGRDKIVAGNFDGFHRRAVLYYANTFVEMAGVVAHPFTCEARLLLLHAVILRQGRRNATRGWRCGAPVGPVRMGQEKIERRV